jgi:hypothetical protein
MPVAGGRIQIGAGRRAYAPRMARRPTPFVERLFLAAIPLAPAGAAVGSLADSAAGGPQAAYDLGVLAVTALLAVAAAALTSRLRDAAVYGVVLALALLVGGVVVFEGVLRILG